MPTFSNSSARVGEMRPSQLMFSFGVGASVDLPHLTVMVMGLDDWPFNKMNGLEISEERLLLAIQDPQVLGTSVSRLLAAPRRDDDAGPLEEENKFGVPVAPFPRWLRCPKCERLAAINSGIWELKTNPYRPDKARYVHKQCPKWKGTSAPTALPVRFLLACENGHLDDFPWLEYAHGGPACVQPKLKLIERGAVGDAASIRVICEGCGTKENPTGMTMAFAFERDFGKPGSKSRIECACRGREPHLRRFEPDCEKPVKTILLGASNSWFPITLSALSVPTATDKLGALVEEHWALLEKLQSVQNVELLRSIGQLNAFIGFENHLVWNAIEGKRGASEDDEEGNDRLDLKGPEWDAFSQPDAAKNSGDFELQPTGNPLGFEKYFDKIVLAKRLREVHALLGFTRIESPGDWGDVREIPLERRGALGRDTPAWVPAVEVRGEGIFLQLREDKLAAWCGQSKVMDYDRSWQGANNGWRQSRGLETSDEQTSSVWARYVVLHSLAHALMRQLCLECGYSSASLRERIYCREPDENGLGAQAGILIYTAAPDSEGTLGGLVSLGTPNVLGAHLRASLESMQICATDPLCAEHAPGSKDELSLHGSACHSCLFSPETSCERGNKFLDRKTLVSTFERPFTPFFEF